MPLKPEQLKKYQADIKKIVPGVVNLHLNESQWQDLSDRMPTDKSQHQAMPGKKLTFTRIVLALSKVTAQHPNLIIKQISNKQPSRACKKEPTPQTVLRPGKRKIDQVLNPEDNQFVSEKKKLTTPLKETGVVGKDSLTHVTPKHGYTREALTPGGTRVRLFFSNSRGSLYKKVTPVGNRMNQGKVDLSKARKRLFDEKLPTTLYKARPKTQRFVATLNQMLPEGQSRLCSQKQLTQATCKDIFIAHGHDEATTTHGNQYHWSHLVAHFLGGDHSIDNLIPATRQCNLSILQIVEREIADRLKSGIPSITITVTPHYDQDDSLIPSEIIYRLEWLKKDCDNEFHHEEIRFNPASYGFPTRSMRASIDYLRKAAEAEQPGESMESETNQHSALLKVSL
ncbi:hypothetical protein GH742_13500 [Legionella sp. MW5194]|uniref:DNA/RNA non-specific endonuclease n=1 Tax=Legionella sp. MW5194 TaxID=2662448 RepID=UPI00193EB893|nr:DNA/RNA non-specific endonuclease [Legionella sp. MW5194]QRN04791.1 hypothetical protein GH742_13500 [Legionella sp. MW5194]